MPPRPLRSATLSFGLVTVPVRFYPATASRSPHCHLVHAVCGSRIKQQLYCPHCKRVVERSELVRGYELRGHREQGGEHVLFTDEELQALEHEASPTLDITEFAPLDTIDPVYFEATYYLGPDKGGEKAYRLLVETLHDTRLAAVIQFVWRGKENVGRFAPTTARWYSTPSSSPTRSGIRRRWGCRRRTFATASVRLAKRLVEELRVEAFDPAKHRDVYRERLEKAARNKARGRTLEIAPPGRKPARVIDIMDALKASLRTPTAKAGARDRAGEGPAARLRKPRKRRAA